MIPGEYRQRLDLPADAFEHAETRRDLAVKIGLASASQARGVGLAGRPKFTLAALVL